MSGVYGTKTIANFDPNKHAEIYLAYSESRSVVNNNFTIQDTGKFLTRQMVENSTTNPLGGIYNLKMPLDVFNKVGIYNICIRPKQMDVIIQDIGVLSAYPDIRGIVLKQSDIETLQPVNDSLIGYKIEYYDQSNSKVDNLFRIITSNNKCEPISQNITTTTQKALRYRFNDNSDLIFITVSPSASSNVKPNTLPYIGNSGTKIVLSNTFFNPVLVEIEVTENDIETLFTSINGNQIRNIDNGLVTTYDKNNEIFSQHERYVIKETATGKPIREVKENKTNIDFSENYTTILGEI
jgi:hypothetical protein